MRVLIVTSEWPRYNGDISGIHVVNQVTRLLEAGVNVTVFHFYGQKNPFHYIKAIIDLSRFHFEQYDVVHAHHGQAGIVALSQQKLPVVITFHGSDLQGIFDKWGKVTLLGYILKIGSRIAAKSATEVIIVSEHLQSFLPPRSFHVIPMGFDLEIFNEIPLLEARRVLGLSFEKRLVLFVGNTARTEKRYWLAEESINLLRNQMNVELVIANGICHEKMPLYMSACDVLLLTSSNEGSPTVVKEALACNLPVVSTNVGDVRERIGSIEKCIICEDDRPETIAAGLTQVLSEPQRINGRKAVLDLDERILTYRVIQVYKLAIEASKTR